jgi:hypothetical protein
MGKKFEPLKYESIKLNLEKIKEITDLQEFGIQTNPDFESARYTLFDNMYDTKSIYSKLLTRANRNKDPEFKLNSVSGESNNLGIPKSGVFVKIRGHVDNYMINAVNFTMDQTLPRENKKLKNPYLQLDVWSRKKEINTDHKIKTIGIKEAKQDLERMLVIELPVGIEATI